LDAATLRNEAVAVFAGPIAGELLARRDASNSIGELHSASVLARRAAELEGCAPSELLRNVVLEATALVEREDAMIRIVAGVLKSRKHISNDRPSLIPKVLSNVGREPIKTALLSPRGHAHFDKIMGALEHLWFLCGEMAL
jgi:hypothetical protein